MSTMAVSIVLARRAAGSYGTVIECRSTTQKIDSPSKRSWSAT